MARLTIWVLGFEVFSISNDETAAESDAAALSGGLLDARAVGFTRQQAQPEDVPLPQRTPAWDEPEER